MNSPLQILTLAIAIALPLASDAQDINLSKGFGVCMDKSGGVTQAMIECIGSEAQRQDARLNKAYKALMAELGAERKKQLQEAQRAWIKFRDAHCNFYADPDGGSLARVSGNDCLMMQTAIRAAALEALGQ